MKIEAHVLSASNCGDELKITAQGQPPKAAQWRPYCSISITVPMTDRNRRAFYVGRRFDVEVKPR